jgi:uncharacterized protein YbjT (DUF2867 family)
MALRAFGALAARRGVRRLVLLSARGEEAGRVEEEAVRESGAEWTILRAGWLAQAFSESCLRGAVANGEVALPVGDAREPFVDADDIADVAVAALTEPGHAGRILELTGPRALTFADAISEIARASGRPVRSRRVTPDEFANGLLARGVSAAEVEGLLHRFATVVEGANAFPSDGVERVLGRGPRDFGWYARRAAAADAWGWSNGRA